MGVCGEELVVDLPADSSYWPHVDRELRPSPSTNLLIKERMVGAVQPLQLPKLYAVRR